MNISIDEIIDNCIINCSDYDICIVIHKLLKNNFRYVEKNKWEYLNDNNLWVCDINQLNFKNTIKTTICRKFIERAILWADNDIMSTKLLSIGSKLKENKYICIIIKECKQFFII
jgi:hypothetical protein